MSIETRVGMTPVSLSITGRGNVLCTVRQYPKSVGTRWNIEAKAREIYRGQFSGRVLIRTAASMKGASK